MLAGTVAKQFQSPAAQFGIAGVHAQQIAGKQRRLIAAGASANFQEQVAGVVRIARQQQQLQCPFLRGAAGFGVEQLILGQGAQVRIAIAGHLAGRRQVIEHLAIGVEALRDRFQLCVFLRQGAEAIVIADDVRFSQQGADFFVAGGQLFQLGEHRWVHGRGVPSWRR